VYKLTGAVSSLHFMTRESKKILLSNHKKKYEIKHEAYDGVKDFLIALSLCRDVYCQFAGDYKRIF
jgi:hypothetical protein